MVKITEAASPQFSSFPRSSTDHQNHYTYEVFLSFRGEDTRFNFTDHLHAALCRRGIETFRDDKLRRGEDISQELLKAIEESRVSIIIFSQNYASSRWCLDELIKILECRRSKGQEVRSVFYKVDPSDVRKQIGAFGDSFAKLDQCKYKDSICKWRKALEEAADLSGWPFKDGEYEAKFINDIVGELSAGVVNPSCVLQVAAHPVGLESSTQDVIRLLDVEENNKVGISGTGGIKSIVRMVGIWGIGGIGKTTIAKNVFNLVCHKFEVRCFLANVSPKSNSSSIDHQHLVQLQQTLLSDILGNSTLKVSSVDQGISFIKTRMQHKKIFLIIDDVSHSSQLQYIVPSLDCFGNGSRILITTRDKRWLIGHEVNDVYQAKMLHDWEAMNLFSWNAFKRNEPPSDYLELAQRAICFAQGLPLALIILGSHLFRRSRKEWEATIGSCKGGPPQTEIQDVLRLSYDALGADLKELFLDIACFFKGEHVDSVKPILEARYDLKSETGIAQLEEKSLLRIDRDEICKGGRIWMHDLIEEMGREIVRQEGEPGERSRLWNCDDVDHVLADNTGTKKIKAIQVQGRLGKDGMCLNAKSFSKMKNLRYFSINHPIKYSGNIDYLSNELRWLNWYGCPIQSFPSNFHPRKLVELSIPDSPHITRLWKGLKNFPILTSMDLRCCESLTELPDFTGIPNLIQLLLDDCVSLVEIHHSVGSLEKLEILSLEGCTSLQEFPKIIGKIDSLRKLYLSRTGLKELHPIIGNLSGLKELYLDDCKNLTTLPCSIYELQNLEILEVGGCSKLVTFSRKASISHDDNGSLALPKLRVFKINGCHLSTADFIGNLDCLETLNKLDLSSNNFVTVPALGKFVNLAKMSLCCCKRLREIPELPPNISKVNASDCTSLERFLILPKSLNMVEMNMWNCHRFSHSLGYDMEKMENILQNNQNSRFVLVLPGSEVPKWFHCSKEVANENGLSSTGAISFEISNELKLENMGVALCSVSGFSSEETLRADMFVNGVHILERVYKQKSSTSDSDHHMWFTYIPLSGEIMGRLSGWYPYKCRFEFYCPQIKSCGVHLVCQPPNEFSSKIVMAPEPAGESGMLEWLLSYWSAKHHEKRLRIGADDDYHRQQEQQEQPFPSKRHCNEEQPSIALAPFPSIDDLSIPSSDYSAYASTSLQPFPSKRHCTEEQPSVAPILIIDDDDDDLSIPSSDYSASASTSLQPFPSKRHCTEEQPSMAPILIINDDDDLLSPLTRFACDWQANLYPLPHSQSTLANLQPTSPATPEFQQ